MIEYNKLNVKLTDTKLKKLKTAVKNNVGATFKRMGLEMFNGNGREQQKYCNYI